MRMWDVNMMIRIIFMMIQKIIMYDDRDGDSEGGVLIPEKDREEKFWYTVNTRSPANF